MQNCKIDKQKNRTLKTKRKLNICSAYLIFIILILKGWTPATGASRRLTILAVADFFAIMRFFICGLQRESEMTFSQFFSCTRYGNWWIILKMKKYSHHILVSNWWYQWKFVIYDPLLVVMCNNFKFNINLLQRWQQQKRFFAYLVWRKVEVSLTLLTIYNRFRLICDPSIVESKSSNNRCAFFSKPIVDIVTFTPLLNTGKHWIMNIWSRILYISL